MENNINETSGNFKGCISPEYVKSLGIDISHNTSFISGGFGRLESGDGVLWVHYTVDGQHHVIAGIPSRYSNDCVHDNIDQVPQMLRMCIEQLQEQV